MDPKDYIIANKRGIHKNLESNPGCAKDMKPDIIDILLNFVESFRSLRLDELGTEDLVKEILNEFPISCGSFLADWLIKAFNIDDSFSFAFNKLAIWVNREEGYHYHNRKDIDNRQLITLVEGASLEVSAPTSDSNEVKGTISVSQGFDFLKLDKEPHTIEKLSSVYSVVTSNKIISAEKEDFISAFGRGLEVKRPKPTGPILWLLSNPTKKGLQNDLLRFLDIMFDSLPMEVRRQAKYVFFDKGGNIFLNPGNSITRSGAKVKDRKIEKILVDIIGNS